MIDFLLKNALTCHAQIDADKGIHDIGLIESAVANPFQTFGGQSLYPTLFDKAAQLFFGLAQNHGFVDGNKRVALHTLLVFLRLNNLELDATATEFFGVTMKVARGELDAEQIKFWLIPRATTRLSLIRQGNITIKNS